MKICILGLGYIGLPTAVLLASKGLQVLGVDTNCSVIGKLNQGEVHIEETELNDMFKKSVASGYLHFSSLPETADIFIIAVPTPCTENKTCNLSYVIQATKAIIPVLKTGNMIIVESTIAPGSCDDYLKPLLAKAGFRVGKDICLAHCPERVLPGNIIKELVMNDRIIGGCSTNCGQEAADFYRQMIEGDIFLTDIKTAEMTKLVENTFRDVNIALVNELTRICNKLGLNVLEVIELANKHPRVELLQPGPGVGGHCLAIDPYFIVEKVPEEARLIALAREINSSMPAYIASRVRELLTGIKSAHIAIFGLTYKGNIDDCRESPALEIIKILMKQNYIISIYDPHVNHTTVPGMEQDATLAVRGADMILILSDHQEFKSLDYDSLAKEMRTPLIFDTKNIIPGNEFSRSEISLYSLGGKII